MSERIGTFCEKCRQVVCICSKQPTTVRGWLETLPEPLRTKAISQCTTPNSCCSNLSDAIEYFNDWTRTNEGHYFWGGVLWFIMGRNGTSLVHEIDGYSAAKAAYETKVVPQTKANMFGCFAKRQESTSTNGKEYGVSFVSVSADRLAELESKEKVFDDMVIALGRYYSRKEQGNG